MRKEDIWLSFAQNTNSTRAVIRFKTSPPSKACPILNVEAQSV
jgi:hypothetical protein